MPGSNPLEDTGSIKNHASEMHTAGLTLGNHMLCTAFNSALLAEHEAEARNLAIRESFGREEIITTARERHRRLSGNIYKGANAGHAMYATDGASGGRGRGGSHGRRIGGRWGRTDAVIEAPTRTAVARSLMTVAIAATPKPPKAVFSR